MTIDPTRVRPAAVAGTFYPDDPAVLCALMDDCFADAVPVASGARAPKALVVPHAGFIYSGPIAASAYLCIAEAADAIRRVVLLGPSHRVPLRGLGLSTADVWSTPLGRVPIDHRSDAQLLALPHVATNDSAHAPEHSLEVQLPFLQRVLRDVTLVPVIVGDAEPSEVSAALDLLWGGPETVVVISTDLSHYHRYADAVRLDERTAAAIIALRADDLGDRDACGARPLRGLLHTARQRHLRIDPIDLRNSGDTAGDHERVVGYGAFAVT